MARNYTSNSGTGAGGHLPRDPIDQILDLFLAMPAGEAILLHKVIGKVISRLLPSEEPTNTVQQADVQYTAPPLGLVPPPSTAPPPLGTRRRRRRTRAEINAQAGPATAHVAVPGGGGEAETHQPVTQGDGDPGLPGEEIGG